MKPAFPFAVALLLLATLLTTPLLRAQNVGIGTASPAQRLHVTDSIRSGALAGTGTRFVFVDDQGDFTVNTGSPFPAWRTIGNAGTDPTNNFLGTTDAQDLVIRTNNTPRARFFSGGAVVVNNGATVPIPGTVTSSVGVGTNHALTGFSAGSGVGVIAFNNSNGRALLAQNTGGAGNALQVLQTGAANADNAVEVTHAGTGRAIEAVSTNNGNTEPAIASFHQGDGRAGNFQQQNPSSTATALFASHDGLGRVVSFQQENPTATAAALFASHEGLGRVISAQTNNTASDVPVGFFSQASTDLTIFNNPAVLGQAGDGTRGGLFLAGGGVAGTVGLSGQYIGATVVDAIGAQGFSDPGGPGVGAGIGVQGAGGFVGVEGVDQTMGAATAGVFGIGDVVANGVKPFMIDHPQDPANKYLKHFSIESDKVLNQYQGSVKLDAQGEATVELPAYFEAVNNPQVASYMLTPIGAAMPKLHVAEKVQGDHFRIAGGEPGKEVSWTLQTERDDPYLQQYPRKREVVVPKAPRHRGTYLMPELYDQPASKSLTPRPKAAEPKPTDEPRGANEPSSTRDQSEQSALEVKPSEQTTELK